MDPEQSTTEAQSTAAEEARSEPAPQAVPAAEQACGCAPVAPPPAGKPRSWSLLWDLVAVVFAVVIILSLYQPVRVEGTSMLPMLQDQDRLFINKFAYARLGSMIGDSIHRGDVVVFYYPHDETKSYIKRVIALPGDDLRIDHGTVFVNGKQLSEPYVPVRFEDDRSQPEMVVPEGEYFVMGDHRSISSDSRDFGPVPRNLIYGRAAFVYWPVDQAGVVR
jgi:signal peptidase I